MKPITRAEAATNQRVAAVIARPAHIHAYTALRNALARSATAHRNPLSPPANASAGNLSELMTSSLLCSRTLAQIALEHGGLRRRERRSPYRSAIMFELFRNDTGIRGVDEHEDRRTSWRKRRTHVANERVVDAGVIARPRRVDRAGGGEKEGAGQCADDKRAHRIARRRAGHE